MWSNFISLVHRAGFTRNEAVVALFLCAAVISGTLMSAFRGDPNPGPDFRALLAEQDSLFAERATAFESVQESVSEVQVYDNVVSKPARTVSKNSGGMVNINSAGLSELQTLPGVGEATAKKIIAWRTERGSFTRAEDIKKVPSIGEKKFEKMKHRITLE
jgi:comEA protein